MKNYLDSLKLNVLNVSQEEPLREAIAYFRSRPGFERLFDRLVEKYLRLGRLGGIIVLEDVNPEERQTLEAFFRRSLPGNTLRLAAGRFEQALAQTRFGGLNPLGLLAVWNGEDLVTRTEQQKSAEIERQTSIQQLMAEHPATVCQAWLKAVLAKDPNTRQVQRALIEDRNFIGNMAIALKGLVNLPETYQRLPVFARRISGDPHGLDLDRGAGKLFLAGLRYLHTQGNENGGGTNNSAKALSFTEELNELLYYFKLLRDDLLNLATCFGFTAYEQGQEIPYWKMANEAGAPLNAPLREIVRVTAFYPWPEPEKYLAENKQYDVWIVENSVIFSALLDECISNKPQLVCLHGQFKLASWALLDRLAQSGAVLHYSGDFDPEGLQMAEKLLLRYPGRVRLWRMTEEDYLRAAPSISLEKSRLSKLKSIISPELEQLARTITTKGLIAYQEGILEELIQDIRGKFGPACL